MQSVTQQLSSLRMARILRMEQGGERSEILSPIDLDSRAPQISFCSSACYTKAPSSQSAGLTVKQADGRSLWITEWEIFFLPFPVPSRHRGGEKYYRAVLTLGISLQDSNAVIKLHRFDVEWRQDAFLVLQRSVINIILIGWQDDAHVTEVDVDSS